jgi:hypothetical protein
MRLSVWLFLAALVVIPATAGCSGGANGGTSEPTTPYDAGGSSGEAGHLDGASDAGPSVSDSGALPDAAPAGDAAGDASDGGFESAAHSPWPRVVNHGGPVLSNPHLVMMVPSNHPDAQQLLAFAAAVPQSQWWSTVSAQYGLGTMTGGGVQTAAMTGAFSDLPTYVQSQIDAGTIPGPSKNNLYLLFVPPAVTGQCQGQYGYHDTWPTGGASAGDVLGVAEYCTPDSQDPSQLDELTHGATHEIAEGCTNPQWSSQPAWVVDQPASEPWKQSPWWSVPCGEIGDMCNYEFEVEGGFSYERVWSNTAAAAGGDPCIPSVAHAFYDVSSIGSPDWSTIQPGGSIDIPLTGWATGPQPPWWLLGTYVTNANQGLSGATVSITSPKDGWFGSCGHQPIADNGGAAAKVKLHVTAPSGAASGDWAVVEVDSYRQDVTATCSASQGTDARHFWFVGVYVQ